MAETFKHESRKSERDFDEILEKLKALKKSIN